MEVYAFTPKGRVWNCRAAPRRWILRIPCTPKSGHQCVGAKVNGQMVSLRHEVVSGDVVEILTQKGHKPSRDWLSFVKSSHAKSKIRHYIKLRNAKKPTEMGKRAAGKRIAQFPEGFEEDPQRRLAEALRRIRLVEAGRPLCRRWASGNIPRDRCWPRYFGEPTKEAEKAAEDAKPTLVKTVKRMLGMGEAPLIVKGHDDLLVFRAKCCNPIPGDDIIGYVTRGRGVAVHTRICPTFRICCTKPSAASP